MDTEPTYAPRPVLTKPDTYEWSDLGGRALIIRRVGTGGLDVLASEGEGFVGFRIAPADVPEFKVSLAMWLDEHAR